MASAPLVSAGYPLFCATCLKEGEVIIGGGGGASKTGVPNGLEVHRVVVDCHNYNRAVQLRMEQICYIDTRLSPVMNCATASTGGMVACGLDEHCRLFKVERGKGKASSIVRLEEGVMAVTDHTDKYPLQKVVRFNSDASLLATGGTDGQVRIWKSSSLKLERLVKSAHTDDVDDLDFHPCKSFLVSVSRDRTVCIWRISNGEKIGTLAFSRTQSGKFAYRARACRFMPVQPSSSSSSSSSVLFTAHCPVQLDPRNAPQSYLVRWRTDAEPSSWTEDHYACLGRDPVTCMACLPSRSGGYVGVGTMQGTIKIFDSDDLQCLTSVHNVHDLCVTAMTMTWVPLSGRSSKPGDVEPAVISVSADRSCSVTVIRPQRSLSVMLLFASLFVIIVAFVMFAF